jgi:4'-phosphopantetheinyl transferase
MGMHVSVASSKTTVIVKAPADPWNPSSRDSPVSLESDEVHVWFAHVHRVLVRDEQNFYTLLCAEERERYGRFRFERDRQIFLVAHAFLRRVLSLYAPVEPDAWRFVANNNGRPEIAYPILNEPLYMNLSHTESLVATAIARLPEVGIDVENTNRPVSPMEIAPSVFTAEECQDLYTFSGEQRIQRFFELWTLKEAYVKARGMGLSLDLKQFRFVLGMSQLRAEFDPQLDEDPHTWHFGALQPTGEHKAAIAVRTRAGYPLKIIISTLKL